MKNFIAAALVLTAIPAFARSPAYKPPAPASAQKISDDQVQITLFGEGAEQLFESLDVESTYEFGFAQVWTKTTSSIVCKRSILGDIAGRMSGPNYFCKIVESVR